MGSFPLNILLATFTWQSPYVYFAVFVKITFKFDWFNVSHSFDIDILSYVFLKSRNKTCTSLSKADLFSISWATEQMVYSGSSCTKACWLFSFTICVLVFYTCLKGFLKILLIVLVYRDTSVIVALFFVVLFVDSWIRLRFYSFRKFPPLIRSFRTV